MRGVFLEPDAIKTVHAQVNLQCEAVRGRRCGGSPQAQATGSHRLRWSAPTLGNEPVDDPALFVPFSSTSLPIDEPLADRSGVPPQSGLDSFVLIAPSFSFLLRSSSMHPRPSGLFSCIPHFSSRQDCAPAIITMEGSCPEPPTSLFVPFPA